MRAEAHARCACALAPSSTFMLMTRSRTSASSASASCACPHLRRPPHLVASAAGRYLWLGTRIVALAFALAVPVPRSVGRRRRVRLRMLSRVLPLAQLPDVLGHLLHPHNAKRRVERLVHAPLRWPRLARAQHQLVRARQERAEGRRQLVARLEERAAPKHVEAEACARQATIAGASRRWPTDRVRTSGST